MTHSLVMLRWMLLPMLVMSWAAGCGKKKEAESSPAPLASVNGVAITEEDFAFEVKRRTETGRPIEDAQRVLQDLIERQAMLQKAASSDVMKDPVVKRELENRQLGQWLDRSLQVERDAVRVSDDEVKAHYDANKRNYTKSELIRLAILYRRANTNDAAETIQSLRAELESARAAYLADPSAATQQGRMSGFGSIAASHSEDTISRYRGGDIGWMEVSAKETSKPREVMEIGRSLDVGAVSDVMMLEDGFYIVMKTDRRDAQITSLEQVAPGLRRNLIREKQEVVERTFMSNLLAEATIQINADKAAQLQVPSVAATPEPPVLTPLTELAPNRKDHTP
jgi:parvulin-like peptidyl-prolyl isomerase